MFRAGDIYPWLFYWYWGIGNWELGMGHGVLDMGHWARGIGHGALGMGHRAYLTFSRTAIVEFLR